MRSLTSSKTYKQLVKCVIRLTQGKVKHTKTKMWHGKKSKDVSIVIYSGDRICFILYTV